MSTILWTNNQRNFNVPTKNLDYNERTKESFYEPKYEKTRSFWRCYEFCLFCYSAGRALYDGEPRNIDVIAKRNPNAGGLLRASTGPELSRSLR